MSRNRQDDKELVKALYKYMLKNYHKKSGNKSTTKEIVEDILDPDHRAEVDPDKIPGSKSSVMNKAGGTAANPASRPDAGFGKVIMKNKKAKSEQKLAKAKGEEKQRRKKLGSKASWDREKAHMEHWTDEHGKKYMSPGRPERHHEFGINAPHKGDKGSGTSVAGRHIKEKTDPVIPVKRQRQDKVAHLKAAPKPDLPKSESGLAKKDQEPPKPPKAKKPMRLQNRPRIKGVKRLKNYMKKAHG